MITEYGFNQLKSKQTSKKNTRTEIWKIWDAKLLISTSTKMTDVWKNYSNKHSCHPCPVCKLEEETIYHLVVCNVNMSFGDFQNVYGNDSRYIELVAVAVRESVNTRNRFIWIINICYNFRCCLDEHE